jgi:hypothetical protein
MFEIKTMRRLPGSLIAVIEINRHKMEARRFCLYQIIRIKVRPAVTITRMTIVEPRTLVICRHPSAAIVLTEVPRPRAPIAINNPQEDASTSTLLIGAKADTRPAADNPYVARIYHHKTRELVEMPLYDEDGTVLWPELTERLDGAPRRGTLIVMRDKLDRKRKTYLPWKEDYFRHRVAEIRAAAGIDPASKFMGLRHGGNTEGADADLTDAQLRALSGHKTASMTALYAKQTMKQRREGARKRLAARTKSP